ncbi:bifunctional phosphoribosylaminoimidazolecarboxamide formyltransferase/IMP cyclohydrolase [Candidatus Symbiothrix dinenymphae]|nr:bifunctional phosphoribosylaminoimidazolecarboxamide formyltransferase/IMP cyclohydrolase [Candidatus Symbiothrix dinenymphae]
MFTFAARNTEISSMVSQKKIKTALISVFHKDGLDEILTLLHREGVKFYSTGGTQTFIESLGMPCNAVENLTGYPSILGGRVKTLHPKVFGGILNRRDNATDQQQIKEYDIPGIDLVIVDLYPFSETVASGASDADIIEKIDIGGISLIRAAAKNFNDVVIVASKNQYGALHKLLTEKGANSTLDDRKWFAKEAFAVSSGYDAAIFNYFDGGDGSYFRQAFDTVLPLRYGENPHQKGMFYGDFDALFEQLHGKEISYNNLLDINAAIDLISEFDELTFAVLKHNNACGIASRSTVKEAWEAALAGDPVSAYGGVLICNAAIDVAAAEEINKLFLEVIIAPAYDAQALEILRQKKNRIILVLKQGIAGQARKDDPVGGEAANHGSPVGSEAARHCGLDPQSPANHPQFRSLLNGVLVQDKDASIQTKADLTVVTTKSPTPSQVEDLLFANKLVKNTKSNAIVLAKDKQLCASGVGQTSRIDALKQAIEKARAFGFDLDGAVMASDAFFPFPDCVEVAHAAGITAVIQPGGSVRDDLTVDYCNKNELVMVTTGIRHFKH